MKTLYRPELLYSNGTFITGGELLVGEDGRIKALTDSFDRNHTHIVALPGKALLPGFINAHSHSFQRLIRGKSESRVTSGTDFWSWRGTMYHAANSLDPQQVYDVARMAFLEMLLSGTTTVGEFHYLHTTPNGQPYDDPNLLAKQVIAAAQSVGIRIVLLRTAYLRAGFELPPDPGQLRFYETTETFLHSMSELLPHRSDRVQFGVAPHSIRAVPLADLHTIVAFARAHHLRLHMHVAEQLAENAACLREYGATPVALLAREAILGPDFTAVHAVHVTSHEIQMLADARTSVCSCPTTERNLGDGFVPADAMLSSGIRIALGSDSQAQIDPLEDARQLEYHLRLQHQKRAILDQLRGKSLAAELFDCATRNGAQSLAVNAGALQPGEFADCFTIDLNDPSIAGSSANDLLPILVFSLNRSAVRDVIIGGQYLIEDQHHPNQAEIIARYRALHTTIWPQPR